jgi:hypothetical protein
MRNELRLWIFPFILCQPFSIGNVIAADAAISAMDELRIGMMDRSKSVTVLSAALAERRRLSLPDGGVQAMISSLRNDIRIMDSIIDKCGNHPDSQRGECNIPSQYAQFTPPPDKMPHVAVLNVRSSNLQFGWRVQEPGRILMLTGMICFHYNEMCYANGASNLPDAFALVSVNNRQFRYSGTPIPIPYTPGQETVITVKIMDSNYDDNTGELKASLY